MPAIIHALFRPQKFGTPSLNLFRDKTYLPSRFEKGNEEKRKIILRATEVSQKWRKGWVE